MIMIFTRDFISAWKQIYKKKYYFVSLRFDLAIYVLKRKTKNVKIDKPVLVSGLNRNYNSNARLYSGNEKWII